HHRPARKRRPGRTPEGRRRPPQFADPPDPEGPPPPPPHATGARVLDPVHAGRPGTDGALDAVRSPGRPEAIHLRAPACGLTPRSAPGPAAGRPPRRPHSA